MQSNPCKNFFSFHRLRFPLCIVHRSVVRTWRVLRAPQGPGGIPNDPKVSVRSLGPTIRLVIPIDSLFDLFSPFIISFSNSASTPWWTTDNHSCFISQIFNLISLGRIMSQQMVRYIKGRIMSHIYEIANQIHIRRSRDMCNQQKACPWKVQAILHNLLIIRLP